MAAARPVEERAAWDRDPSEEERARRKGKERPREEAVVLFAGHTTRCHTHIGHFTRWLSRAARPSFIRITAASPLCLWNWGAKSSSSSGTSAAAAAAWRWEPLKSAPGVSLGCDFLAYAVAPPWPSAVRVPEQSQTQTLRADPRPPAAHARTDPRPRRQTAPLFPRLHYLERILHRECELRIEVQAVVHAHGHDLPVLV